MHEVLTDPDEGAAAVDSLARDLAVTGTRSSGKVENKRAGGTTTRAARSSTGEQHEGDRLKFTRVRRRRVAVLWMALTMATATGCSKKSGDSPAEPTTVTTGTTGTTAATPGPIYVVVFTHIEDNTPSGTPGTAAARASYLQWRSRLIAMAESARGYGLQWVLQPDWKLLEAALLYEDATVTASTGGQNLLQYLRGSLGVAIDPHSHENGGYNYTDVAYLLNQLGVGGSTVIGGHIWDPGLAQFAHWERFRVAQSGEKYSYSWRGDILMGAGTPNHTNDPVVSGVWRPSGPNSFFVDSPSGNITAVGGWKGNLTGIDELTGFYQDGKVASACILTSTYHVQPSSISSSSGLSSVERDVLSPLASMRATRQIEVTDFTTLVATWKSQFSGKGCAYQ